ncbi:MAG: FKBP-type peptidyl-prolyl cis-trans isomerase [Nitrospira sp.]|nr:FKBP-type peptidyl-prolyl cis-trans isomerase [Nitrospira sp.]
MMVKEILHWGCAGVLMVLVAVAGGTGTGFAAEQESELEPVKTESGLVYVDLVEGSGQEARAGDNAVVHYTGWLEDGTKFDSSVDRGEPFSFQLGAGRVIKGWDEGVAGMHIGGKRKLTIPSHLGYGDRGAGGIIPPDATLIFEVELLDLR